MQAKLMTLGDMPRVVQTSGAAAAAAGRAAAFGTLGELGRGKRRDAAGDDHRMNQWRLREYVTALVKAYGYREDYRGSSPPWSVPYIPLPFAGEMLDHFAQQARYWLGRGVPDGAKQPRFIRNRIKEASAIVEAAGSIEDAPAAVAAKAPEMFKPERPAGQPHAKVLKAEASWRFLDALLRLAIHLDVLGGQPGKLDIFLDAVKEEADSALDTVGRLPERATKAGRRLLTWAAIGVAGLGLLYAVTR